jgi:hypothetical protein
MNKEQQKGADCEDQRDGAASRHRVIHINSVRMLSTVVCLDRKDLVGEDRKMSDDILSSTQAMLLVPAAGWNT